LTGLFMSFDSRNPTFDDAIIDLQIVENATDVSKHITDCIFSRRFSVQMRSLNLLLEHADYRERAACAIVKLGFPL
jgi:hypothetical protein